MPLVSVVIPVYNVEKYIRRCLTSIQQQSLSDIEIIVVNDCTPDHSMTVVSDMAEKDQRIKIINLEMNEGPMIARERGYMAARGDYVTFCDGDDMMPQAAIDNLYSAAVESDADIVSGNMIYKNQTDRELLWVNKLKYGNSITDVFKSLLRYELVHNLCGKLFKTSLLQDFEYHTYEHATNGEDGCLLYQVVENMNKTILINDTVYYYMQNSESSTQKRLTENGIKSICILNKTRENVVSPYPELYADLNRCVTNILCGLYVQGYNDENTHLSKHVIENGLEHYVSFWNIMKYLKYVPIIKTIIRYRILE